MLRNVMEKVPDEQWDNEEYPNPNWQIAYHTLLVTNVIFSTILHKLSERLKGKGITGFSW